MPGVFFSTLLISKPLCQHHSFSTRRTRFERVEFPLCAKPNAQRSSLQVVKTNAYQFALATDGQQRVEILARTNALLRFDRDKLYADLNATGWHRSRQPGGGPIPERLKDNPKLNRIGLLDNSLAMVGTIPADQRRPCPL